MKFIVFTCMLLLGVGQLPAQESFYSLDLSDEDGNPLSGVLALDLQGNLLAESGLNGRLLLAANLPPQDTLSLQLFGFDELRISPEMLGLQPNVPIGLQMQPIAVELSTVAVIGRRNELARDLPYRVETVGKQSIALLQSASATDALADLSGVYVQKSQFGGGSPVVRGFEANRVLLVIDGVRMNNAIYRNGHLQNAITVDVNALDRMELIYGPGSLAYGSDALGGVIHFRTHQPTFHAQGLRLKAGGSGGFSTAANGIRSSFDVEVNAPKFAAYTQLSFTRQGDLRAGGNRPDAYPNFGTRPFYVARIDGQDSLLRNSNPDRQLPSGYRQYDWLQKIRWQVKQGVELQANFQLSTSSDIPRYDQLIEVSNGAPRWAEWFYGPQTRVLGSLRLNDRRGGRWADVSSIIVAHQFIEEDRIQRRFQSPNRERSNVDVHNTTFQWDLAKAVSSQGRVSYGIDARFDRVLSDASLTNLDDGTVHTTGLATRYPEGGSSLASTGLYLDYRHRLSNRWEARLGGRYSHQWMKTTFREDAPVEWPQHYLDGITNREGAFTGAASINYQEEGHRLRLLFAQGFRAPNVDDFAKFRERNGFVQVPNPNLRSERSNSLELGYQFEKKQWSVSLSGYHSWLANAIIRNNFLLPDGRNRFVSFGDTLRVQANVNAERARIYGLDFEIRWRASSAIFLSTDFHWLKGLRDQRAPDGAILTLPQDHIPPAYGQFNLTYEKGPWQMKFRLRYQLAKSLEAYAVSAITPASDGTYLLDRTGTSDNLELTPFNDQTGEFTGSLSWYTLNWHASYAPGDHWTFLLGIENILDTHYRPFASGISAPGRNLSIGFRIRPAYR